MCTEPSQRQRIATFLLLRAVLGVALFASCAAPRPPLPQPAELVEPAEPPPPEEPAEPPGEPAEPPPPEEPPPASVHLMLGTPVDGTPADDIVLMRDQMVIGYSPYLNAANWVSWRTTAAELGSVPRYSGKFLVDKALPEGLYRPNHDDYTNSGFDRGHMVRSEERTSTAEMNKATFVLSNILPQTEDLNRGPWYGFERALEEKVRPAASAAMAAVTAKDAYVVAGAVWPASCATHQPRARGDGCRDLGRRAVPTQRIAVPEATFKIMVFVDAGQPVTSSRREILAVLMPNVAGIRTEDWKRYLTTVEEIERRTGYDLLSAID